MTETEAEVKIAPMVMEEGYVQFLFTKSVNFAKEFDGPYLLWVYQNPGYYADKCVCGTCVMGYKYHPSSWQFFAQSIGRIDIPFGRYGLAPCQGRFVE